MKSKSKVALNIAILFITISIFSFFQLEEQHKLSDIYFHTELIRRIQEKEPLNTSMNFTINNWQYENKTRNWTAEYVSNYPKMFHFICGSLPLSPETTIKLVVPILFALLCIGIFTICLSLGHNLNTGIISIGLFLLASLSSWNYVWYYINGVYSQLILNIILVFGFAGLVYILRKKDKFKYIFLAILIGIFIPLIFLSHNIPTIPHAMENAPRFIPLIYSILIPVLVGVVNNVYFKTKKTKKKM